MNAQTTGVLEVATIRQQCKVLHLPTVAAQSAQLAEQAVRERRTHLSFLEALLAAELEERERKLVERRIHEAHLARMKTLEEFDFSRWPTVSALEIRQLAEGGYIEAGGARHLYRRQRHRQDPSVDRTGGRGLPAKTPGPLRHRRGLSQRVG